MIKQRIEEKIGEIPLVQFEWISPKEISFKEEVRQICKMECPMYGNSWSCPPAVGTVSECREQCMKYEGVFLFTTIAEVSDIANFDEALASRAEHEKITRSLGKLFQEEGVETLLLSSESCAICKECSYCEGKPCRYPEYMIPCIESYGILVTAIAEAYEIPFLENYQTIQWFGMIFYR